MGKADIRVEGVDAFFERGRKVAALADRSRPIPPSKVIAFENVESLLSVLTEKRVGLLGQIKKTPGSITALAEKLNRDRSAVARDVQLLERFGIVLVSERPLHGHGRQKWIEPVAGEISVTAEL